MKRRSQHILIKNASSRTNQLMCLTRLRIEAAAKVALSQDEAGKKAVSSVCSSPCPELSSVSEYSNLFSCSTDVYAHMTNGSGSQTSETATLGSPSKLLEPKILSDVAGPSFTSLKAKSEEVAVEIDASTVSGKNNISEDLSLNPDGEKEKAAPSNDKFSIPNIIHSKVDTPNLSVVEDLSLNADGEKEKAAPSNDKFSIPNIIHSKVDTPNLSVVEDLSLNADGEKEKAAPSNDKFSIPNIIHSKVDTPNLSVVEDLSLNADGEKEKAAPANAKFSIPNIIHSKVDTPNPSVVELECGGIVLEVDVDAYEVLAETFNCDGAQARSINFVANEGDTEESGTNQGRITNEGEMNGECKVTSGSGEVLAETFNCDGAHARFIDLVANEGDTEESGINQGRITNEGSMNGECKVTSGSGEVLAETFNCDGAQARSMDFVANECDTEESGINQGRITNEGEMNGESKVTSGSGKREVVEMSVDKSTTEKVRKKKKNRILKEIQNTDENFPVAEISTTEKGRKKKKRRLLKEIQNTDISFQVERKASGKRLRDKAHCCLSQARSMDFVANECDTEESGINQGRITNEGEMNGESKVTSGSGKREVVEISVDKSTTEKVRKKKKNRILKEIQNTDENFPVAEISTTEKGRKKKKRRLLKEIQNTDISFQVERKASGKRLRDKAHCCLYCRTYHHRIGLHLEKVHPEEAEVSECLSFPLKSKKRSDAFSILVRKGDFYHNCEVIKSKTGELILTRRVSEGECSFISYQEYTPCPYCVGFFQKSALWKHVRYHCPLIPEAVRDARNDVLATERSCESVHKESSGLLAAGLDDEQMVRGFRVNILAGMKEDGVKEICEKDEIIFKVGVTLYEQFNISQVNQTRSTIRLLSRIRQEVSSLDETVTCFKDCISPKKFDALITAARNICGYRDPNEGEERAIFEKPYLVLKLKPAILLAVSVFQGDALRMVDDDPSIASAIHKKIKAFLILLNLLWSKRMSSTARFNARDIRFSKSHFLPLTSDVIALRKNILSTRDIALKNLIASPTYTDWRKLAVSVMLYLILFNRRRAGETSKLKIEQFNNRGAWKEEGTEELKSTFSDLERELSKRMSLVYIRGKTGDQVPLLIDEASQHAIDQLIKYRAKVNMMESNRFVFSVPNTERSHLRASHQMRQMTLEAKCVHPEYITGTNLRKHIATVVQVCDLTRTEQQWVAKHMGHSLSTHEHYYRLHESAAEVAKISRLLIAIDQGLIKNYKGKALEAFDPMEAINSLPTLPEEMGEHVLDHEESEETEESSIAVGQSVDNTKIEETLLNLSASDSVTNNQLEKAEDKNTSKPENQPKAVSNGNFEFTMQPSTSGGTKRCASGNFSVSEDESDKSDEEWTENNVAESVKESIGGESSHVSKKKKGENTIPKRNPVVWSEAEKKLLFSHFRVKFDKNERVTKKEIEILQQKYVIFKLRFWRNIRDYYHWKLADKKKAEAK